MTMIRNPVEWGLSTLKIGAQGLSATGRALGRTEDHLHSPMPTIRRIGRDDLRDALAKGFDDFASYRTDVIFLCIFYPIVGLILGRMAFGENLVALLFPFASGFALIGPFAAIGLEEMSRRHEMGDTTSWTDAFSVLRSPSIGAILALGIFLVVVFLTWMFAANEIYRMTFGPEPPASIAAFVHQVFTTGAGWVMIVAGCGVGFLFAVFVLTISVVSFPLLLDRQVGIDTAVWTSLRAVGQNPGTMALWGLIVATLLVVGSIPLFLGLIIVMPVLGHATWHLYRKIVPR
jgi:uncharacterized membrane protein